VLTAVGAPPSINSQVVNKVFVEHKGGFKGTDVGKLARVEAERQIAALEANNSDNYQKQTTIGLALQTHRQFKTFSLFCQGLLAGFSLCHIVFLWVISINNDGFNTLIMIYQPLSLPLNSLYYLLLVISTVAIMDRYDVSSPTRNFVIRSCTMQNGCVAVFIYLLSLTVSLAMSNMEDKINLNSTSQAEPLWQDQQARDSELKRWLILCTVRAVTAILAWFVVSLRPNTDRLSKNLQRADDSIGFDTTIHADHKHI